MKLANLKSLHETGLFNMAGFARELGIEPQTLSARLRRNSPELSVTESERLEGLLMLRFSEIGADLRFRKPHIPVKGVDGVERDF